MATNVTFTGDFSLEELLEFKTIPELKELAFDLGVKFKGSPKKQGIVKTIAKIMLDDPKSIVRNMFYYELKACHDVIDGRMTLDYAEKSGLLFELNRFGLIYSTEQKSTGYCDLRFCKELTDEFTRLVPRELERREKSGALIAEKVAIGCANLYGYTDMYYIGKLIPELDKRLGCDLSYDTLTDLFYPALTAMRYAIPKKNRPFLSPFSVFNGFEIDAYHIDIHIEPKIFDFDTIVGYGEMPYPHITGSAVEKMRDAFKKYGKTDVSLEDALRDLWIDKQDETKNHPVPDINRFFQIHDISQLQYCVGAVVDFLNSIPYWRLRGNSSEEIGKKKFENMRRSGQQPKISIGPNMRAMGIESFEQLQEMARKGQGFPNSLDATFASSKKIGRNDPCPCGSGKKYKNCCGR